MPINPEFWASRRVLLTGHTGFKGAWLSLWLQSMDAQLTGLAPGPPTSPSLYELAAVGAAMSERALDVRDAPAVQGALREAQPEIVLHLAAQPLVRRSLRDPLGTYEINVMGTANVLEAVRRLGDTVRAVVIVTSDKCYANTAQANLPRVAPRFVETDPLGGGDPYSSSKACAELVAGAYRQAFFAAAEGSPRVATARAGNVIGGGDWGEDRLIPDIVRAVQHGEPLRVRNPRAVRPWQHVLNPLGGYLLLAERLFRSSGLARAWNFGPPPRDARPVEWIVGRIAELWDDAFTWVPETGEQPPEASYLALDSSAAEAELGWRPSWPLERALESIVAWHRALDRGQDARSLCCEQIERFAVA